jgi:hypothetical protein
MNDNWQLMDRKFSREWRRNKLYRLTELRRLAAKRGCQVAKVSSGRVNIVDGSKVVARFQLRGEEEKIVLSTASNGPLQTYAALKL